MLTCAQAGQVYGVRVSWTPLCVAGVVGGVSRIEMVPKQAMEQPASMDGHARECPVCTECRTLDPPGLTGF